MASINTDINKTRDYAFAIAASCGTVGYYVGGPLSAACAFAAGGAVGLGIGWSKFSQEHLEKIIDGGKKAGTEIKEQALEVIKNTEKYLLASGISGPIYWIATRNLYSYCSQSSIPYICNLPIITDSVLATSACVANTYLIISATNRIREWILSASKKGTEQNSIGPSSSKTKTTYTTTKCYEKTVCAGKTCLWTGAATTIFVSTPVGAALASFGIGVILTMELNKWWRKC